MWNQPRFAAAEYGSFIDLGNVLESSPRMTMRESVHAAAVVLHWRGHIYLREVVIADSVAPNVRIVLPASGTGRLFDADAIKNRVTHLTNF